MFPVYVREYGQLANVAPDPLNGRLSKTVPSAPPRQMGAEPPTVPSTIFKRAQFSLKISGRSSSKGQMSEPQRCEFGTEKRTVEDLTPTEREVVELRAECERLRKQLRELAAKRKAKPKVTRDDAG
jgi:hypothetical protein